MEPTMSLAEFVEAYQQDDNLPWRLGDGHLLNLLDEAIELLKELGWKP